MMNNGRLGSSLPQPNQKVTTLFSEFVVEMLQWITAQRKKYRNVVCIDFHVWVTGSGYAASTRISNYGENKTKDHASATSRLYINSEGSLDCKLQENLSQAAVSYAGDAVKKFKALQAEIKKYSRTEEERNAERAVIRAQIEALQTQLNSL